MAALTLAASAAMPLPAMAATDPQRAVQIAKNLAARVYGLFLKTVLLILTSEKFRFPAMNYLSATLHADVGCIAGINWQA